MIHELQRIGRVAIDGDIDQGPAHAHEARNIVELVLRDIRSGFRAHHNVDQLSNVLGSEHLECRLQIAKEGRRLQDAAHPNIIGKPAIQKMNVRTLFGVEIGPKLHGALASPCGGPLFHQASRRLKSALAGIVRH